MDRRRIGVLVQLNSLLLAVVRLPRPDFDRFSIRSLLPPALR